MKILITGATGLIGTELVSLLLQNGISIHYLTTSKKEIKNEPNYQGFYWNPQQGIIDENALLGVDTIVHLAGASISMRWTSKNKQEIIESRTLSTNLLYRILKSHPHQVKHIVSASAIGIYPDSLTAFYTEDNKSVDNSFLGQVVAKWEETVDNFKRLNIKVCKIRTGLVLSEKGGMLKELLKPIKVGMGSAYGSGKQWQSWIHMYDLAHLYHFAIQNQWEGVYNATAPNPVDNHELVKKIAAILEKPFFMPNVPEFLLKALLGEMYILLVSSQNVSSQKAQDNGFVFKFRTLDKALDNLLS
ncbi:TIGR01777 family oxidoreductase [Flavobacterium microcysteis]|uniref:TIGR01777 family protein n=1 Tax=Flavobacterium microcysteis TaxID=2596891 RepID=A0A501Q036_9FLAO|nr:TIGR01777 family oxidoreductase [Flavobacterium microcysteis]TPD66023.1 TIGR01777 family protein [Flavobacterium microcysteis]